jgi:hypothetical protein
MESLVVVCQINRQLKLMVNKLHQGWETMMESSIPTDKVPKVKDIEQCKVKMKR